jgi:hypothetical protein
VKGRLLLNVVVGKSTAVFELFAGKDQTLLVRRDTLLILNLGLHIVDSIRRLDLKSNGLSGQGLDEDLHTTTETQDEMEGGLLLNVVVREGPAVLKLLSSEDKALLVRRDSFLVLDLGFYIVDGIRGFDLERNGLSGQGLDENLHTTAETQNKMEGRLLLNVVVRKSTAILELLSSEDETLLVWGNSLLVLNFGLHVIDRVRRLDLERDGLASEAKVSASACECVGRREWH